jgi:hypothetical protein
LITESPPTNRRTYVWDQQNRLKQVTKNGVTTTFTYRSDGLRASKAVNGVTTNYVYDGQTVVGETRSDGRAVGIRRDRTVTSAARTLTIRGTW